MEITLLTAMVVAIGCCIDTSSSIDPFTCTAGEFYIGQHAIIACDFGSKILRTMNHFEVQKYPFSDSESYNGADVLRCDRLLTGKYECKVADGYQFDQNVEENVNILIPIVTEEFEGQYVCQLNSEGRGRRFCSLYVHDTEERPGSPTPGDVIDERALKIGLGIGVICFTILLAILAVSYLVVTRFRTRTQGRSEAETSTTKDRDRDQDQEDLIPLQGSKGVALNAAPAGSTSDYLMQRMSSIRRHRLQCSVSEKEYNRKDDIRTKKIDAATDEIRIGQIQIQNPQIQCESRWHHRVPFREHHFLMIQKLDEVVEGQVKGCDIRREGDYEEIRCQTSL